MADDAGRINELLAETSFLYGGNAAFIEDLYARWLKAPDSVEPSWRSFFTSVHDRAGAGQPMAPPSWTARGAPVARPEWLSAIDGLWPAVEAKLASKIADRTPAAPAQDVRAATLDSLRAIMMIRAYRMRGHLRANLDPLGMAAPEGDASELDPASYGFSEADYDRPIFLDYVLGLETGTLREILAILKRTYCSDLGVQYMHISDPAQKAWLQERIEGRDKEIVFTREGKIAILKKLIETEGFERFLHKRFPGTKRFGLDGGESMVPALEQIIKRGGALGVQDIVIGMPHRGRLNVLAAVMGKPYHVIFHEFQGGSSLPSDVEGSGDVKYHMGASSDRAFDGNTVHLSLTANPSHLEIVNPVVLGKARAKQAFVLRETPDAGRSHVLPLLLHGDAAFAGQGVVAECFAISGTRGYRTGGCVHFIVNNQIGFTTAPKYSRSSPYPSDVALMVEAPIFHVNGDDPEATVYAAKVATEFRQKFGKDVVIDMFCYRRFGHNEGDDPTMTSPLMYARIKDHPSTREIYARQLIAEGVVTEPEVAQWMSEFEAFLDAEFDAGKAYKADKADWLDGKWAGLALPEGEDRRGNTSVPLSRLKAIGERITVVPEGVDVHKNVRRVIEARKSAIVTGEGIDWATGEHLAFGSLLQEGFPVRLAGQDSVRGTFTQRHSDIVDQTTEAHYTPLNNIGPGQAHFEVIDSPLSEEAVLGFEYGFSLADPKTLVLWEGQFGDFANGAQVVIDQFISSGERKWLRMSGLVLLLPHGYEGQGPEHSSARLERFLQLCAEDNLQVVNCTTPANYFHVLRRQMRREFRKPLVVMTPKSLLRHKKAVSLLSELAEGSSFHRVLHDDAERGRHTALTLDPPEKIRRVVLCSGKVYFDLLEAREERGLTDIYLMRLEQFYPWPMKSLSTELSRFPNAELVWCQEEPKNMGGWTFVDPWLELTLERLKVKARRARYVGRPASASTAAGQMSRHNRELQAFLTEALA
ncbi:MAG: 2-oxoglutarate dehydrogenase E1 component [Phenylobacterium sp.]|uniref:2-oxoglutarate dehydrogenase E1 component n=1 Tax=Phenylobacterium sp. TaxID=1871053 RepID=UPI0025FBF010|nr:2-oxoglutarate dehydrogenase E1 component [Phenylobacterium sp.]MCA6225188.1 2-oxoglutarate dehydrogenase E1 component [Phenylobacterium sp.]MCA6227508.1 2-oxoglutarate dehydrogenase E1 component [Phenylobacterium sp.]MCA6230937.1 2-oxoglutarate dehydrogenase E1 component [Phenylobacterium sp.]MCA6234211.1 2-oxoglutarate dehydrogenase E1 component [Phenylobacterium sp.]MCA6249738.1 2-oxoglutarate dehydrogenase E1 component [Phenylobacterium sp.]